MIVPSGFECSLIFPHHPTSRQDSGDIGCVNSRTMGGDRESETLIRNDRPVDPERGGRAGGLGSPPARGQRECVLRTSCSTLQSVAQAERAVVHNWELLSSSQP